MMTATTNGHAAPSPTDDDGWTRRSTTNYDVMQTLMAQMDKMQRDQDLREKENQALKQQVTRELLKKQKELYVLQSKLDKQEERIKNLLKLVDSKQQQGKFSCPRCGSFKVAPVTEITTDGGSSASTTSTDLIANKKDSASKQQQDSDTPRLPHQASHGEVEVDIADLEEVPLPPLGLRHHESVGEAPALLPQVSAATIDGPSPIVKRESVETPRISNKTSPEKHVTPHKQSELTPLVEEEPSDKVESSVAVPTAKPTKPHRTFTPLPTNTVKNNALPQDTVAVPTIIEEGGEQEEEGDTLAALPAQGNHLKPPTGTKPRRTFTPLPTNHNKSETQALQSAEAVAVAVAVSTISEEEDGLSPPKKVDVASSQDAVEVLSIAEEEEEEEQDTLAPLPAHGDHLKPPAVTKPRRTFTPLPTNIGATKAPQGMAVATISEAEEEEDELSSPNKVDLIVSDKKVEAQRVPSIVFEKKEEKEDEKVGHETPEQENVTAAALPDYGEPAFEPKSVRHRKKTPYPVATTQDKSPEQESFSAAALPDDQKPAAKPKAERHRHRHRKKTPYPAATAQDKDIVEDIMNDAQEALKPLSVEKLPAVEEVESTQEDGDLKQAAVVKPMEQPLDVTPVIPTEPTAAVVATAAAAPVVSEPTEHAPKRRSKKGIQPTNQDELLLRGQSLTVPPTNIVMPDSPLTGQHTAITMDSALEDPKSSLTQSFTNTERLFIRNDDDFSITSNTVASSTYHEDRAKLVNHEMMDPHGETGTYTGVILASTGMPHGLGRMVYTEDGRIYEGDWRHGMWHGFGKAMFFNGDSYEGEYRFDQRHGRGFYQWNDGRQYDGEFSYDKRHGRGTFKWPDGSSYEGDFVQGQREGQGRYFFKDGGCYEGGWVDGFYDGYGECTWADGRCYKGEWKQGRAHGRGVEAYANGTIRHDGMWDDDDPVTT